MTESGVDLNAVLGDGGDKKAKGPGPAELAEEDKTLPESLDSNNIFGDVVENIIYRNFDPEEDIV